MRVQEVKRIARLLRSVTDSHASMGGGPVSPTSANPIRLGTPRPGRRPRKSVGPVL